MQKLNHHPFFVCAFSLLSLAKLAAQENNSGNISVSGHWELTAIHEQPVLNELFTQGIPYLVIEIKEPIFTGFTGCNLIRGNIEISGNNIKFLQLISSKKYCEGIPENEFLDALEKADRFLIKGNMLYLLNEVSVLLSFKMID